MRGKLAGGLALLLLMAVSGRVVAADEEDGPLHTFAGPYRGTVIDLETGRPIPSAAVIILWQRLDDQIEGLRRLVAAREVFTNEHGEFLHDVAAVESRFPPRTFAPRIMIFRPGYVSLPDRPQLFPPGVAASRFSVAGAEVRLTPLTDYEDRAEAFNTFIAMLSASQLFPPTELPETFELIRFELQSLGVQPPKPVAPGGGR